MRDKRRSKSPTGRAWLASLFRPLDATSLVVFRAGFGGLMCYRAVELLVSGEAERLYVAPSMHIKYPFLGWLPNTSSAGLIAVLVAVALSSFLVAVGCLYRLAAATLFLAWSYVFFCDQAPNQNHDYLMVLLGFLFVLMPLNRSYSVDALIRPSIRSASIPAWCLYLLRFQVAIVYIFGGIRKLNPDWLRGEPIRTMLHSESFEHPIVGQYFLSETIVMTFVYGGLLLDLPIVPALLWGRTRILALIVSALFHATNAWLWDIDIFPWFMIFATTLFFPPDWPRAVVRRLGFRRVHGESAASGAAFFDRPLDARQRLVVGFLAAYAAMQVLVPCRPFLYPGHPLEQEQLLMFSWNMMLKLSDTRIQFVVVDNESGESWEAYPESVLSTFQLGRMGSPDMMHQTAQHIARLERAKGRENVSVYVHAMRRVHARDWEIAYDPRVDFASLPRTLGVKPWIPAFREKYPPPAGPRAAFERARWKFCKENGWLPLPKQAGNADVERRLMEWEEAYWKSHPAQ